MQVISIEGCDGCGKATQSELLVNWLISKGYKAKKLSFPNYNSTTGTLLRQYLNGDIYSSLEDSNPYAVATMYALDRHMVFENAKEELSDYDFIVCDRYIGSNLIHQTCKLPKEQWRDYANWISDLEVHKYNTPKPQVTFYLSLSVEEADKRMISRYKGDATKKDIHETDKKYLQLCRICGDYMSRLFDWNVIDCDSKTINEVGTLLTEKVSKQFNIK